MTNEEDAIEMFVGGLVLDPNTQAPVVVLKDESGEIHLPIWIGIAEATSIASAIKEINMGRPLTHDLMADMIADLGARVERIVITELKEQTYYAELVLSVGEKAFIFDSRPSDAIAISLRTAAPIYVTKEVLDRAHAGEGEDSQPNDESSAEEATPDEEGGQMKDLKNIDKDKWNEILESLDSDDFKYKT